MSNIVINLNVNVYLLKTNPENVPDMPLGIKDVCMKGISFSLGKAFTF
jgi:hypothetical protein